MAKMLLHSLLLLLLLLDRHRNRVECEQVGINYGRIADNLPSPSRVAKLIESLGITKVKLYDADPTVLTAFANTNVEFIVAIDNGKVTSMLDSKQAEMWIQQNIKPYLPATRITCVTVGNEILGGSQASLSANLLPAMQSVYQALVSLGLSDQINVTTAHSLNILGSSYPPSSGAFGSDVARYIKPILNFHSKVKSPFFINAYPYFAYKADPVTVKLPYVLFEKNAGVVDSGSNLKYDNMLYAQIDSVYYAIKAMGHGDVDVRISETGWPSKGDSDEPGATPENAGKYNGNLMERIKMNQGTPLKPNVPIEIYVFALFNEDLKPGPTSERNFGLYYPNETPVYSLQGTSLAGDAGNGYFPELFYSSSPPLIIAIQMSFYLYFLFYFFL
ncbi:Beta-1,3-endoglucanase, family GH17 [Zostera marina]|uniref:glucan endo-1,3-beta-D-glucosidase n=1 Tax=Zostera marina TaxID=29655 RepID=A0A0K9PX05_ZOSMR|nr:Beta-1,3-endoglucanase, family GH17 [Zostera marina]